MAAELQFSLTELGYKTLISNGLTKTLTKYGLSDFDNSYKVTAKNDLLTKVTGYHEQITDAECGKAKYEGMFPTEPTEEQILNTRSKVQYLFNRVECDYEFTEPSIQLKVNIDKWINDLENISSYSYNMQESLVLELWSYISLSNQSIDLVTKDYTTYDTLVNNNFIYTPQTSKDKEVFQLVSPKYVQTQSDSTKKLVWNSGKRFLSPFVMAFGTNMVNGQTVHGTRGLLSFVTDEWGYYCDGQFLNIQTVEGMDPANLPFKTIYPACKIANTVYALMSNQSYLTQSKLIGYLYNMVSVKDNTTTALKALTNQAKLFFKSNGNLMPDGSYQLTMNFNVYGNNTKTNKIDDVSGNIFGVTLSYNPNIISSEILELIQ